ncbi:MAG: transcriptional regulator [Herpetosiphonaceae bacterium]|nr:transcriptional regulator [Herpetosiphonaceae bacterium]
MTLRTQSKAARLQQIEHKLYNTPQGLSAVELAAYCGVDRRTIYRDILTLEEVGAPIWQLDGKFGLERGRYQSTVRLNLNETVALYFAARLLAHHSDENNPSVVSALEKIAASLPNETLSSHMSHAAAVIKAKPLRGNYIQILETLTRAWADRRLVRISYWATDRPEAQERVIAPYFLEVSRSEPASYVLAHDRLRNALRTFKVERIQSATLLDEEYTIPDDFDPYAWLDASWGIMAEDPVEVRLRFTPAVARRVRESVWHHSQQLTNLPDGGCILTVSVGGTREIKSWVMSWGADVDVLAPLELRAEIANDVARLAVQYRSDTLPTSTNSFVVAQTH